MSGRFKKGRSGNPGGRPKQTEQDKLVKTLTKETFNDLCQKMMTCTKDELEEIIAKSVPYEVELFIRHMLALGENPDWNQYQKYLERRIGKVQDEMKIEMPKPTVIRLSDGGAMILGTQTDNEQD